MFTNILNNGTISSNGSMPIDGLDLSKTVLLINILNPPTGTSPSLIFNITDVDPIDQSTSLGNSITSPTITGAGATTLILTESLSDTIKVSWTLGGTNSPTFTGVNVALVEKNSNDQFKSSTATNSNVAASASSVTLLSANVNRLLVTIFNDSTDMLYIKLGATASTSSFTVKVLAGGYYELPWNYTGRIDGIWSGTNGAARISELC